MPGTPVQTLLVVIIAVSVQLCENGSGCPVGGPAVTVKLMLALPVRPCASEIATGKFFDPPDVAAATVAEYENVLSPAVVSPLVPSSKNCCDADPPIVERSP